MQIHYGKKLVNAVVIQRFLLMITVGFSLGKEGFPSSLASSIQGDPVFVSILSGFVRSAAGCGNHPGPFAGRLFGPL